MLLRGEASYDSNQNTVNESTPIKASFSKVDLHSISASKTQAREQHIENSYILNALKEETSTVSHSNSMTSSSPVTMVKS